MALGAAGFIGTGAAMWVSSYSFMSDDILRTRPEPSLAGGDMRSAPPAVDAAAATKVLLLSTKTSNFGLAVL